MSESRKSMPLGKHLKELRSRILICLGSVTVFSVGGFLHWPTVLNMLLPTKMTLVYTSPQESLLVRFRASIALGTLLSIPVITFEIWRFLNPALTQKERHFLRYFFILSSFLFAMGVVFNLYLVFPTMVHFFLKIAEPALTPMISVSNYSLLALNTTLAFAFASQVPILMAMSTSMGLVSPKSFKSYRKPSILGIFILAAILTPPDAFSQVALALPMLALFELGIVLSKIAQRLRN